MDNRTASQLEDSSPPFNVDDVVGMEVVGLSLVAGYVDDDRSAEDDEASPRALELLDLFNHQIGSLGQEGRIDFLRTLTLPPNEMHAMRCVVQESIANMMDLGLLVNLEDGDQYKIMFSSLPQFAALN